MHDHRVDPETTGWLGCDLAHRRPHQAIAAPMPDPTELDNQSLVSQERPIAGTMACSSSRLAESPQPSRAARPGRRRATPVSITGVTKSTTFAISSTRPGVGNAHCIAQRSKTSRSTGAKVKSTTGTSERPAKDHARRGRGTDHRHSNGPTAIRSNRALGDSQGCSISTLVITARPRREPMGVCEGWGLPDLIDAHGTSDRRRTTGGSAPLPS